MVLSQTVLHLILTKIRRVPIFLLVSTFCFIYPVLYIRFFSVFSFNCLLHLHYSLKNYYETVFFFSFMNLSASVNIEPMKEEVEKNVCHPEYKGSRTLSNNSKRPKNCMICWIIVVKYFIWLWQVDICCCLS